MTRGEIAMREQKFALPVRELDHLRSLAARQAEIAALPVMETRKERWRSMNDAVAGARPPFAIESWTFDRDFLPDSMLCCETEYGRTLERNFLRNIRHHEILDDDHVCPDTLDMEWRVELDEFGVEIPTEYIADAEGVVTGYRFDCPIKDLKEGWPMVKPSTFSVDRKGTAEEKSFLGASFGDLLPVALRSGTYGRTNLTQRLMRLISMEDFFIAMYDCPEGVHGLLGLLRDNAVRMSRWAEAEGLLVLNNGNQVTCGTCYNFTSLLPKGGVIDGPVRLSDMWGVMDSQETVGVSPEFFDEFVFPYYRELAEMFGLVYWGCCEPVDPIWDKSLSRLPNLKAVSVSRWADQRHMAEVLDGKGIVFSRKPDPNLLGVVPALDEEAWAKEIRNTLQIVSDHAVPFEFVVRDVYTMHGNLGKARRAVQIAKREIDAFYGE